MIFITYVMLLHICYYICYYIYFINICYINTYYNISKFTEKRFKVYNKTRLFAICSPSKFNPICVYSVRVPRPQP